MRRLPALTGEEASQHPWRAARSSGYLRITVTPQGFCARLDTDYHGGAGASFFWPPGYAVHTSAFPQGPLVLVDDQGGRVAEDGTYLFVRGRRAPSADASLQIPAGCGATRRLAVFVVTEPGRPGTPVGATGRPVVAVDGCGRPSVRPTNLGLYCADAGVILNRMRYASWGRQGATGTATAQLHCTNSAGQMRGQLVPVRFTFGAAYVDSHSLLRLGRLHLHYLRSHC